MNRKRIGIILIVVGALLALIVGVVVYIQVEKASEVEKRIPTVEVVVALTDLPDRMPIPATAVGVIKVTPDVAPVEAATDLKQVVGKYPLAKIYKSEVVIQAKLAATADKTTPAYSLKEGMVAITYAGADSLAPTGAIRPGDRVDILLSMPLPKAATGGAVTITSPTVAQTMLQNVQVLRVGSFAAEGETGGKAITFMVDHQDALAIKWAKDAGGVIDLVLRHPADVEPVVTDAVTAQYVFRRFRFTLAEPIQ